MENKELTYEEELEYERRVLTDLYADCTEKWANIDPTSEDAKYLLDRMEKIEDIRAKIPEVKEPEPKPKWYDKLDWTKIGTSLIATAGMVFCTKKVLSAEDDGIPFTSQAKMFIQKFNLFR